MTAAGDLQLTLGAIRVLSMHLTHWWRGAWVAELDLDPDDATQLPSGRQTLTMGTQTLSGTLDPRGTGRFAAGISARLVAGAGGWDQPVPKQQFHADNGITSTRLYQATAAIVGETVNDPAPVRLGVDWERKAGRASQVFADRDYFVDLAGVTQVGSRPPATPDPSTEVLAYDPAQQRVELASDVVVMPGTVLSDPIFKRFDGTLTVRDVEQTVSHAGGSRATAWCGAAPASRLMGALTTLVRETSGVAYARTYLYRHVATASDGRLTLQAVDKAPGLPDNVAISVWPGAAGAGQKLAPGQGVRVAFTAGDPSQPVAIGFDSSLPLEASLNAKTAVHLGRGGAPVARVGDTVVVYLPVGISIGGIPSPIPIPVYGIVQTGSTKVDSE